MLIPFAFSKVIKDNQDSNPLHARFDDGDDDDDRQKWTLLSKRAYSISNLLKLRDRLVRAPD